MFGALWLSTGVRCTRQFSSCVKNSKLLLQQLAYSTTSASGIDELLQDCDTMDEPDTEDQPESSHLAQSAVAYRPSGSLGLHDQYLISLLQAKLQKPKLRGLDVHIGINRGVLDELKPNLDMHSLFELDISSGLADNLASNYAGLGSSISLSEQLQRQKQYTLLDSVRPELGLDVLAFSSCIQYFNGYEDLQYANKLLRRNGRLVFYHVFDPELQVSPYSCVHTSQKVPAKISAQYRLPNRPFRSGVKFLLSEIEKLHREKEDSNELSQEEERQRWDEVLKELAEQYGIKRGGPALRKLTSRFRTGAIGTTNPYTVTYREMKKHRYQDNLKPDSWQVEVAKLLKTYRNDDERHTSYKWREWLTGMQSSSLYGLSAMYRVPLQEYSTLFSVTVDIRDVLVMWQDDPSFWHLDEGTAAKLKQEVKIILEEHVPNEDLDENGRLHMVCGSYLGSFTNIR
ncbi:hypothetical protein V1512DRAFT_245193 [Lipomyces arxii]|uniref:uncharacterized protein n=1 Tax=Lipomyces arxii TaxID=56418 RepID=UPI0034CFA7AA